MPQWSQGLLPGSTVQVFSRSKNSTNSDTASPIPVNCSWLGCEVAGTYVPLSHIERVGVVCGDDGCDDDAPSRSDAAGRLCADEGSVERPFVICDSMPRSPPLNLGGPPPKLSPLPPLDSADSPPAE